MKYIIDDQKEQIEFLNVNVKVNYERIKDFKEEKDNWLAEIDFLRKVALANKDLTNVQEGKAKLFLTELKALRTDKLFPTSKVETLSKSRNKSQSENNELTEKFVKLSPLNLEKKI